MTRKSPQEKKQLDYERDHFTPGWNSSSRMFAKTWRGKKTHANRQYRRRSQELLVGMKTGIGEDDLFSDDLTAARFQESVSRKRLRKQGTMTLREKVETKLSKRATMVGRRARTKREAEAWAKSAVATLGTPSGREICRSFSTRRASMPGKRGRTPAGHVVSGSCGSCAVVSPTYQGWLWAFGRCTPSKT